LFALGGNPEPPPGVTAGLWRVSRTPAKPLEGNQWLRRESGIPSDAYHDERSSAELASLLATFDPGVVILDQLWMHSYEEVIRAPGRRLVLNAHNAEAALAREIAEHETYPPLKLQRRRLAARIGQVEGGLARRADQIWVCSQEDRRRLESEYAPCAPIHVVPNALDTARYRSGEAPRPSGFAGSAGPFFLFTAAFNYPPNRRAAAFLIEKVFPALTRRYAEARLVFAGLQPAAEMLRAAATDPRIVVTGAIPDTLPYLRHSSMLLAPLFEGGGTRFKILEAFAANLPVISSAKGAEGLGAEPGTHYLLANDADAFVQSAALALDPGIARALTGSAAALAEQFSWEAVRRTVAHALDSIPRV
jgi:polysaccharide biosynthesis protein PslH